jgi:hypothetical protein
MPFVAEVNLSSEVCQKIRKAYFPDQPWIEVKGQVSVLLNRLIKIGHLCFPDEDQLGVLRQLRKWSAEDVRDALDDVPHRTSGAAESP